MLVAFVALLIATSGTAYAASLAANSVGHVQMKDNAIYSPEVANGSLKAVDVAPAERVKFRGVTLWHRVGAVGEVPFGAMFGNSTPANPTRYRREGDVVRLDGTPISTQVGPWDGFATRLVFTLPLGYRPAHELFAPIAGQSSAVPSFIYVNAGGGVYISGSGTGFASLTGVTFTTG